MVFFCFISIISYNCGISILIEIIVKIIKIDPKDGKIGLSRKEALADIEAKRKEREAAASAE